MGKKRGRQPTFFSISKSILGVDIIQKKGLFGGGSGGGSKRALFGGSQRVSSRGSSLQVVLFRSSYGSTTRNAKQQCSKFLN